MNWIILSAAALIFLLIFFILKIFFQLNDRLNEMQGLISEQNKIIGQGLGSSTSVFGDVKEQLGRLEATNSQILEMSKNISTLQELLRVPKFRGQMGETLLENILSQVLPQGVVQMQYRFRTGDAVDAVISLGGRLVPIDAKFSLDNFQRIADTQDEQLKSGFRRKFIQDVKNRVDEVASKYILPSENTYDFALMYIPAENVYYETIIKEDIFSYCLSKKVIPVSPNTFYIYLQVICIGLKGLKVEENAKVIIKNLAALSVELEKFSQDFQILGSHISNTKTKYDDSQRRFEKLTDKLSGIQDSDHLEK